VPAIEVYTVGVQRAHAPALPHGFGGVHPGGHVAGKPQVPTPRAADAQAIPPRTSPGDLQSGLTYAFGRRARLARRALGHAAAKPGRCQRLRTQALAALLRTPFLNPALRVPMEKPDALLAGCRLGLLYFSLPGGHEGHDAGTTGVKLTDAEAAKVTAARRR
jgi:hypothetical protein